MENLRMIIFYKVGGDWTHSELLTGQRFVMPFLSYLSSAGESLHLADPTNLNLPGENTIYCSILFEMSDLNMN